MVSEVQIINAALSKIDGNYINAIGQDGIEGETTEILYELVRDSLIAAHPWNFAIGRAALVEDAETPAFEYTHQYVLPADCLRAWQLYNSSSMWKVEGRRLLTSDSSAKLIYIKKVTNTGNYSAGFVDALICKLAAEIVVAISGSRETAVSLLDEFKMKLREAKRQDGQEGHIDNLRINTFTSPHFSGTDNYEIEYLGDPTIG